MIERTFYESQSADEAWDALSRMYTHARPRAQSPDACISFDSVTTPEVSVDRGYLHSAGGAFSPSPDQINIISVVGGQIELDFGRRGVVANRVGDSYLYLPDSSADLEWKEFGALAMRLPTELVATVSEAVTDLPAQGLRFLSPRPASAAGARLWRVTAEGLWNDLGQMERDGFDPLRYQALLNLAISAVVTVFPNTAMTRGYLPGPGKVEPAALRRAIAYIDAHASLPITVADIAQAAGCSPRDLRGAFRRNLDMTPTAYLQRVRLEGVHEELKAADPTAGAAVVDKAKQWGFTPGARFAEKYRRTFGTDPEDTLNA